MHMDDNSWHMVKNVPKVLSFIGGKSDKPIAISDKEFSSIMKRVQDNKDSPKSKSLFEPGELICVKEGPFKVVPRAAPPERQAGQMVADVDALIAKLRDEAKVLS